MAADNVVATIDIPYADYGSELTVTAFGNIRIPTQVIAFSDTVDVPAGGGSARPSSGFLYPRGQG